MRIIELDKITAVSSGQGAPQGDKSYSFDNGIPFIKAGDMEFLTNGGSIAEIQKVEEKVAKENKLTVYPKGSVVFAKSGMSAKKDRVYCLETKSFVVNHLAIIEPNEDEFLSKYLTFYLQFYKPAKLIQDDAYPSIRISDIRLLKIPLPTLSEQKAIVVKLDRAQRLIDIDRKMLAKYDELIQSVFLEMFGDPVKNPKGWEVKKLGDILENKDSERVPVKKSDRKEMAGEYPYYGASGIVDYVDDYLFEGPNLLIGEDGANLLSRSTDIAFIADGKYWVNNHAHVLGSDKIERLYYVKYFINNLDLEPYVTGSAQPKLNQSNLNKIEVPMPETNHIDEFKKISDSIQYEIEKTNISLKKSEELFSSLVQGVFG